jgi:hypothetical protein
VTGVLFPRSEYERQQKNMLEVTGHAGGRNVIERSGSLQVSRHRIGYEIDIHWRERGNLSLEQYAGGMTLCMPFIPFSESGYPFGYNPGDGACRRDIQPAQHTELYWA